MKMNRIWSTFRSYCAEGKLKFVTGLALIFLFTFNSPSSVEAQDCLEEDHFVCYITTFGPTILFSTGLVAISNYAGLTKERDKDYLSESELIEARDQLLEYQSKGESNLKDYQLAYRYPALSKYIDTLRRKKGHKSSSIDELIELAAEIFSIEKSTP